MKGWFKKLGFIVDNDDSTTQQSDSSVAAKDSQQTQRTNQQEQPITQMLPFKDFSPQQPQEQQQQQKQQLPITNTTLSKPSHDIVVVNSERLSARTFTMPTERSFSPRAARLTALRGSIRRDLMPVCMTLVL